MGKDSRNHTEKINYGVFGRKSHFQPNSPDWRLAYI